MRTTRWQGMATAMRVGRAGPAPPRAPPSARRWRRRPRRSSRCGPPGSPAAPARPAAGRPCPARRAAGRGRCPGASTKPTTRATSASKSASPPISAARGKRSWRSRTSVLRIVAQHDGADALERFSPPGWSPASTRRPRSGSPRRRRPRDNRAGVMPSTAVALLVEPAVGAEPGVVDRFRHGRAARELIPDAPGPVGRRVVLGRHARDRLEHAVEVERAEAGRGASVGQASAVPRRPRCAGRPGPPWQPAARSGAAGPACIAGRAGTRQPRRRPQWHGSAH